MLEVRVMCVCLCFVLSVTEVESGWFACNQQGKGLQLSESNIFCWQCFTPQQLAKAISHLGKLASTCCRTRGRSSPGTAHTYLKPVVVHIFWRFKTHLQVYVTALTCYARHTQHGGTYIITHKWNIKRNNEHFKKNSLTYTLPTLCYITYMFLYVVCFMRVYL